MEIAWLCGFAFLAGFVDAVVGGGGLIQIPALFLFLPPAVSSDAVRVLGTNKMASICGTSVAMVQYARRVSIPWPTVLPAALSAFAFSALGALAVSRIQSAFLRPLVLVLLVLVGLYTFLRPDFGSRHNPIHHGRLAALFGAGVGAVIGFYDGFFGPGTGSFLIFAFVGWFGFDFLSASAGAKVVNVATNLSAILYFAGSHKIAYGVALPMGLFNILGAIAGARLAILKGSRFVRVFFLVVISAMILRFGWSILRP
jgi:uncharacterized protein